MGYVGGKIPGHSGTAQKNKKVFARKKQWAKGRSVVDWAETEEVNIVGKYETQYNRSGFSDWMILLVGLLLLGAGSWWAQGVNSSYDAVAKPRVVEVKPEGFSEKELHAYNFLVSRGRKSLAIKDFRVAANEFNEALKITPFAKQARLGLLQSLKEMCAENAYYCDQAEEQSVFVERMGWLKENDPHS